MSEWTLTDRGRSFLVSDSGAGAVLATADGRPVLEEVGGLLGMLKAELGQVQGVRQQLRIELGFGRSVRQVVLVEHSAGKPAVTRLVPPMGSRARRLSWLPDVGLPWLRYLVPLGIAVAVASREVQRRQARERREAGYRAGEGRVESAAEGRTAEPGAETSEQVESSTPPRVAGSRSGPTRAEPAGDVDDADR